LTRRTLAERIVAIDVALATVPHAFGGAIALAYYAEPRATIDIDLNVFVPAIAFDEVADPLSSIGVAADTAEARATIERDGQARVFWDATPVDLFFAYDAFHDTACAARRMVPFADVTIPILGPEHLVVCKTLFDRPKDWVDIDAMIAADTPLDVAEITRWVGRIAGDTDRRYDRIVRLLLG
jgi:hypothetical protein